jgi:hypothetical protein
MHSDRLFTNLMRLVRAVGRLLAPLPQQTDEDYTEALVTQLARAPSNSELARQLAVLAPAHPIPIGRHGIPALISRIDSAPSEGQFLNAFGILRCVVDPRCAENSLNAERILKEPRSIPALMAVVSDRQSKYRIWALDFLLDLARSQSSQFRAALAAHDTELLSFLRLAADPDSPVSGRVLSDLPAIIAEDPQFQQIVAFNALEIFVSLLKSQPQSIASVVAILQGNALTQQLFCDSGYLATIENLVARKDGLKVLEVLAATNAPAFLAALTATAIPALLIEDLLQPDVRMGVVPLLCQTMRNNPGIARLFTEKLSRLLGLWVSDTSFPLFDMLDSYLDGSDENGSSLADAIIGFGSLSDAIINLAVHCVLANEQSKLKLEPLFTALLERVSENGLRFFMAVCWNSPRYCELFTQSDAFQRIWQLAINGSLSPGAKHCFDLLLVELLLIRREVFVAFDVFRSHVDANAVIAAVNAIAIEPTQFGALQSVIVQAANDRRLDLLEAEARGFSAEDTALFAELRQKITSLQESVETLTSVRPAPVNLRIEEQPRVEITAPVEGDRVLAELKAQQGVIDALRAAVDSHERREQALRDQIATNGKWDKANLQARIDAAIRSSLEASQRHCKELEAELAAAKKESELVRARCSKLDSGLANAKCARVPAELEVHRSLITTLPTAADSQTKRKQALRDASAVGDLQAEPAAKEERHYQELDAQLAATKKELESARDHCRVLDGRLASAEGERGRLLTELEAQLALVAILRSAPDSQEWPLREQISDPGVDSSVGPDTQMKINTAVRSSFEVSERHCTELEAELAAAKADLESARERCRALDARLARAGPDRDHLRAELEAQQGAISAPRAAVDSQEQREQGADLHRPLDATFEAELAAAKAEAESARLAKLALKQRTKEYQAEIIRLEQLNGEREGLEAQLRASRALIFRLQSDLERVTPIDEGAESLRDQIASANSRNKELESELERQRKRLAKLALAHDRALSELGRLRLEHDELLSSKASAMDALKTKNQELVQQLSAVSSELESVKTYGAELESQVREYSITFEKLQRAGARNSALRAQISELKAENAGLRAAIQSPRASEAADRMERSALKISSDSDGELSPRVLNWSRPYRDSPRRSQASPRQKSLGSGADAPSNLIGSLIGNPLVLSHDERHRALRRIGRVWLSKHCGLRM